MPGQWRYFSDSEVGGLKQELVARLDSSATLTAADCKRLGIERIKYVITSGLRNADDNGSAGGVKKSAHMLGLAVDLRAQDPRALGLIVKNAYAAGFHRIGIYFRKVGGKIIPTHVHVDCDESKPFEVLWLDEEGDA